MCDPTSAYLALTIATTAVGYNEQKKNAQRQEKAINDANAASNVQASIEQNQINENTADEVSLRARQALRERAYLRVATGESGLQGGSQNRVVDQADAAKGFDVARILANASSRRTQAHYQQRGRVAGYNSERARIRHPSLAASGLQIAGAVYDYKNP